MAYYEFTGTAPQIQEVKQLKQTLITALNLAHNIQRQSAQMDLTDMQAQFGVDADLTAVNWTTTINDVVTALEGTGVQNLITKVGFSA